MLQNLINELQSAGLYDDSPILDGSIKRCFTDTTKKSGKKNGWYVGWSKLIGGKDCLCCVYGDWARSDKPLGIYKSWSDDKHFSKSDLDAIHKHQAELQKKTEADKAKRHKEAAKKSAEQWLTLSETGNSQYLNDKGVKAFGLRFGHDDKESNYIAVPIRNHDGDIKGLQLIYDKPLSYDPSRNKTFTSGVEKKGHFHTIGIVSPLAPVLFCEGYATGASIHEATGYPVIVCFDAGNIKPVVESFRAKYQKQHFIICADNDQWKQSNTGIDKATATAKAHDCFLSVPDFSGLSTESKPTDFNDLHKLAGLDAVKVAIDKVERVTPDYHNQAAMDHYSDTESHYQRLEQVKTGINSPKTISFLNADDMAINAKAPDFLINDILETDTHGVIFGASQSFKSFDALAMAYSICTGNSFMNFTVFKTGKVFYICGEGKSALSRRLRALRLAESDFKGNLLVLNESLAIDNDTDMHELKKAIEYKKPVLVIFDTFSSLATNTNENDNTEVAKTLRLIKDTCTNGVTSSILVAHTGKAKNAGERGASAFRANVDFSYELTRQPKSMITTMSCIKNKDGEPFNDVHMKAEIVHLGITRQDGKEATSLVLKPCDNSDKPAHGNKPLDGNNKAVFDQLPKALETRGIDTPEHIKALFPDSQQNIPAKVVSFESWRELANPYITTKTETESARKSAFHRAKDWLEAAYYIGFSGNYAWIIKKS